MEEYTEFNEYTLSDIILFDPITSAGKEAMDRLGLNSSDITSDYFYNELRVGTNFGKPFEEITLYELDQGDFHLKKKKIGEMQKRFEQFERRMVSDNPNQSPITLLGVAGNGKSIELHRIVDNVYKSIAGAAELNKVEIDFDHYVPKPEMTFKKTIKNPYPKDIKWLFCWKLLRTTMLYIRDNKDSCVKIRSNYYKHIMNTMSFNINYTELMELIGEYGNGKFDDIEPVFEKMYAFFRGDKTEPFTAEESARELLKVLMLLMFCTNIEAKNFILIDNIEHWIHVNGSDIQVLDNDIVTIYRAIKEATEYVINIFNSEIGTKSEFNDYYLGWRKFKVITAMRRTSLRLLDDRTLQERNRPDVNIADFTGHFFIPDIWENKKVVWEKYLKNKFYKIDPAAEKKMALADLVLKEGKGIKGISYQRLIARLMSHGIRRNAKAQAHAALDMYAILHSDDTSVMNYNDFERLRGGNLESLGHEAQYMIRRALIESQFRWAISDDSSNRRWRDLGIGNLKYKSFGAAESIADSIYDEIQKQWYVLVEYRDKDNVSLMRRILSVLSYSREYNDRGGIGSGVELFYNVSLYALLKALLPKIHISSKSDYEKLIPISRVIRSLCNMSNIITKGAPFAILNINDNRCFNEFTDEDLAEILAEILLAGSKASSSTGKYNSSDYGIRLTDAGYAFLMSWQTSFSFMAALYCYNMPSLFFLKDVNKVKYIISTVYDSSHILYKLYEKEAVSFCSDQGLSKRDFYSGLYLPERRNGKKMIFRERVKEQHIEHLLLYKKYIQNYHSLIGISKANANAIVEHVDKYVDLYKKWKVGKRTSVDERITKVCF